MLTQAISFRYFSAADTEPMALRKAIEKIKEVKLVEFEPKRRIMSIWWKGTCPALNSVESIAAAAGVPAMLVSHAHVTVAIKPQAGANPADLEWGLAMRGMHGGGLKGSNVELHMDLQVVSAKQLLDKLKSLKFDAEIKTHRWVDVSITDGDWTALARELKGVKGVLETTSTSSSIGLWTTGVSDETLKQAADRAKVQGFTIGK